MESSEIEFKKKVPKNFEFDASYIVYLEKKIREMETQKNLLKAQLSNLKLEIESLRTETSRFYELPLLSGHILDVLDDKNDRAIVDCHPNASYIVRISNKLQKEKIIPGFHVALNNRNFTVLDILPLKLNPYIRGMEITNAPIDVSYNDIGGLDAQIQEVREIVELPLKNPEIFKKIGIEPPKGVLFYGFPGTGKTLLAKAVAHETNATFMKVVGSELVQKFIGEGAHYVREIFELARKKSPTILFIDELDAIGARRMEDGTPGDREVNRTLMQLLSELDGFDQRGNIKFIAATNRADILDPALLRSGRFDRLIEFPSPNEKARESIFKIHMRKLNLENNIRIKTLVDLTKNALGSDIKGICTEAGMYAIRRNSEIISNDDFLKAINKIMINKQKDYDNSDIFL